MGLEYFVFYSEASLVCIAIFLIMNAGKASSREE